jgi:hypothetical protein
LNARPRPGAFHAGTGGGDQGDRKQLSLPEVGDLVLVADRVGWEMEGASQHLFLIDNGGREKTLMEYPEFATRLLDIPL